ncbi:MAG: ECF-type sigma factor [Sphingomonas sp.]
MLQSWRSGGDAQARDQLAALFYPWLERAAAGMLKGERHVSLSSGDLVQEAFVRLIQLDRMDWRDRAHFMALAARVMRRILVDHVRAKQADKRAHRRVTLTTRLEPHPRMDLQALDHALMRLAAIDPQRAEIVEMRYFGGMSVTDVAAVMGLSEPTVQRRWTAARAWLIHALDTSL